MENIHHLKADYLSVFACQFQSVCFQMKTESWSPAMNAISSLRIFTAFCFLQRNFVLR